MMILDTVKIIVMSFVFKKVIMYSLANMILVLVNIHGGAERFHAMDCVIEKMKILK